MRRITILFIGFILVVIILASTAKLKTNNHPAKNPVPVTPTTGAVPFFAHYYLWWDDRHWQSKLGTAYSSIKQSRSLPATLEANGCTAQSNFSGNQLIDIPQTGLYSQDNSSVLKSQVETAAGAGLSGFVVSWSNNAVFDRRLDALVKIVEQYNTSHSQKFYLILGYEGLDNGRNPRPISTVETDLKYFSDTYGANSVFQIPRYGQLPLVMWLDSRRFPVEDIAQISSQTKDRLTLIGDEHGLSEWNRGVSRYFAGDGWYFSSQNPYANHNSFNQIAALAKQIESENKLWFAPLSGGYNKANFGLGGNCVPRNNGETMKKIFTGNSQIKPNGYMYISWNEYLENTYVDPSVLYGSFYLDTLKQIILRLRISSPT